MSLPWMHQRCIFRCRRFYGEPAGYRQEPLNIEKEDIFHSKLSKTKEGREKEEENEQDLTCTWGEELKQGSDPHMRA